MVQINFATREVSCKLVYYGPGLCGKTTNLQQVHSKAPTQLRGNMTSIATEGDRTLFFDFMPLELGTVAGMRTKLQLYTVPGQVYYNATRKIVLEGVDGVIFVADSSPSRRQANRDSWQNLKDNLHEYGLDLRDVPLVLQLNKRDLPDAVPADELGAELNDLGAPTFEAVAVTGDGVMPTLRQLTAMVLERLNDQRGRRPGPRPAPVQERPAPTAAEPARAAAAVTPAAARVARSPAPSGRRAERAAEPVAAREATGPVEGRSKPEAPRPAPRATPAKAPAVKGAGAEAAPRRREVGTAAREAAKVTRGAAAAGPRPAAKPPAGGPERRPRFTLADPGRRPPSGKKALVILGILAIVAVVLFVLLVRGR